MKKTLLAISAIAITFILTAFGYYNWNETAEIYSESKYSTKANNLRLKNDFNKLIKNSLAPEFYLEIGSRFNTVISKKKLHDAKSIFDILPKEATENKSNFNSVSIGILNKDNELVEYGDNEQLSIEQLSLLNTAVYSTNFYVISYCTSLLDNGAIKNDKITYYMTVVPEVEATFKDGQEELLKYIKRKTKKLIVNVDNEKLRPGRLAFTVSKEATVENVEILSSSGHSALDEGFMQLIAATTNQWTVATNSTGEKVEQEFVLFFGKMGC